MDTIIGLVGSNFTLIAADVSKARSIVVMNRKTDKIIKLDGHKMIAYSGEPGDDKNFCDYIEKNISFYRFKTGIPLSTHAAANFTRKTLNESLRKKPYMVNILMGGYDDGAGPSLYYMDYLGNMQKLNYAAHGHASFFVLSILDKHYKEDLTLEEAIDIVQTCIEELRHRFLINSPNFIFKIVNSEGIEIVKTNDENNNNNNEN
eukprot:TRINITY_DN1634_c3_g1_i1.p1 TRINITY_DN1634_c3_g1~~TRINITY_DN1634_c3_g1_i1.p1  ORF type:complete len:204 (-),score=64.75 TRINITY_DN1634_c3_g1_i1:59-670(-)